MSIVLIYFAIDQQTFLCGHNRYQPPQGQPLIWRRGRQRILAGIGHGLGKLSLNFFNIGTMAFQRINAIDI